jgi:hypothetical protein
MTEPVRLEMGTLWWSKGADPDRMPEMKEATPEQLASLIIERDEKGIITSVRVRGAQ